MQCLPCINLRNNGRLLGSKETFYSFISGLEVYMMIVKRFIRQMSWAFNWGKSVLSSGSLAARGGGDYIARGAEESI